MEIMAPSTPYDLKGLLTTAANTDNPTAFVDHVRLFDTSGHVPDKGYSIPFGEADVKRSGGDVTILAVSLMVLRALEAADILADQGIEAEVVDPRTLVPLDEESILNSVSKTGRLVIVDECHRRCGVAAELAATVVEKAFSELKAPIRRVATLDVPVPFSPPMEQFIEPSVERIVNAVVEITD
jgi:pyruvate dehydrogenase E1 component beta subunit